VGEAGQYTETEEPPSGGSKGFNEFRFEDKGGKEEVFLHAQRDYKAWVRHDEQRKTGRDVAVRVGRDRKTEVKKNETLIVETGDETREVKKGSRKTTINKSDELTVETGDKKTTVSMANYSVDVSKGKATVVAMQEILLKVGGNTVKISPMGIEIKGLTVKITADTTLEAQGLKSDIKASTMMTINGAMVMIN
jgi:type VI secretion system secreted protein VgrG